MKYKKKRDFVTEKNEWIKQTRTPTESDDWDSPFGYFLRDRKTKSKATNAVEDEKKLRVSEAVGTDKTGKRLNQIR